MRSCLIGVLLVLSGMLTVRAADGDFQAIRSVAGYNYSNGVEDPLKVPLGNLGCDGTGVAYPWTNFYLGMELPQVSRVNRIEFDLARIAADRFDKSSDADVKMEILYSDDNKTYQKYAGKFTVTKKTATVDGGYWEYLVVNGLDFNAKYVKIYTPWKKDYYAFGYNGFPNTMQKSLRVYSARDCEIANFKLPFIIGDQLQMPLTLSKGNAPASHVVQVSIMPGLKGDSDILFQSKLEKLKNGTNSLKLDLSKYPVGKITLQTVVTDGKERPTIILENLTTALLTRGISSSNELKAGEYRIFQTGDAKVVGEWTKGVAKNAGGEIPYLKSASGKLEFNLPGTGRCAIYVGIIGNDSKLNLAVNGQSYPVILERMNPYYNTPNVLGEGFVGIVNLSTASTATLSVESPSRVTYLRIQKLTPAQQALFDSNIPNVPTVIGHQDGHSNFFFRLSDTPEMLRGLISRSSKDFELNSYDWCVGTTTAVNYKSKITSNFGKGEGSLDGEKHATDVVNKMIADGFDPMEIVIKQLHDDKCRANVVIRMNAVYPPPISFALNGRFCNENPELRMRDINGNITNLITGLSYAYPKMRQYMVNMVKEILEYNPDCIMLEFMRAPPFFGYDQPLIDLYAKRYGSCTPKDFGTDNWKKLQDELMTSMVKEMRQAIDAKSPKIQLHVSFDFQDYKNDGVDVVTWTREGLVDALCPGRIMMSDKKLFDLAPFAAMAKTSPRKCVLIPRVEGGLVGSDTTRAEELGQEKILRINLSTNQYRQIMSEFIKMGAIALRPLNGGGDKETCLALADRKGLALWYEFKYPVCDFNESITLAE
jgi:hypothetical protein